MFSILIYILFLLLVGQFAKRSAWFPKNTNDVLNSFVLYISLPAIILLNLPSLEINADIFIPISFHWGLLIIHFLFLFLFQKIFKFKKEIFHTLLVVTTLGNTAFLGIPFIQELYGNSALPFAVIYDQLGSGIAFILYAAFLIPFLQNKKNSSLKNVFKDIVTFPPFIALALGFILNGVEFHPFIFRILDGLSSTLVPLAIISVGYSLKFKFTRDLISQISVGLGIKLLLVPLTALIMIKMFSLEGLPVKVSLLQSGMPPMVTGGMLAIINKMDERLTTSLVGFGLILSFISLSFIEFLS